MTLIGRAVSFGMRTSINKEKSVKAKGIKIKESFIYPLFRKKKVIEKNRR